MQRPPDVCLSEEAVPEESIIKGSCKRPAQSGSKVLTFLKEPDGNIGQKWFAGVAARPIAVTRQIGELHGSPTEA